MDNTNPENPTHEEPNAQPTPPEAELHEGLAAHAPEGGEVEKLKSQVNETKDKYLRLFADFENYRRRVAKEKLEFFTTANEDLIKALLPVLDDFERAQKSFEGGGDLEAIKQGVALIYSKLYRVLEQKGVKPIEAAGETFDPDLHEAITQFPAPSDDLKGKVVDVVEKGYFLGEKVIRYAKVVVGA
jgi:molecular chaperone GrpE